MPGTTVQASWVAVETDRTDPNLVIKIEEKSRPLLNSFLSWKTLAPFNLLEPTNFIYVLMVG
ncbi:MAG: hypothetical protein MUO54_00200 [Anaerolineales bacterium]|nr:hypothetical protein [Anaerolineales bacterium]